MWNKVYITICLLSIFDLSFSQNSDFDTTSFRITNFRLGGSVKFSLIPRRTVTFPEKIIQSDFYKKYFYKVPPPTTVLTKGTSPFQIGVNTAFLTYSKSNNVAYEIGFDLGYQYSGKIRDSIYKSYNSNNTRYPLAQIDLVYILNEIVVGGYGLIKSNKQYLNLFIGIGLNYYHSIGKVKVTNLYIENEIENYKIKIPSYSNFNPYIPLGFEFPLNDKKNIFMKFIGSVHFENNLNDSKKVKRFFLNGGFQLQYQL